MMNIADIRKDYQQTSLLESEVDTNPILQFEKWFSQSIEAQLPEPNAMFLATSTLDGKPSLRTVLLKGIDPQGIVFYTNYDSRKSLEIRANPYVSVLFFWEGLERQVRIEGKVEKVSDNESDEYYHSRPEGSKVGAHASPQSDKITKEELEERHQKFIELFSNEPIIRPINWGGWRIVPSYFEFWQGRPSRLHDRICYQLNDSGLWEIFRLAP
jgi:pyridoxamine 5'-phosphate oxidase